MQKASFFGVVVLNFLKCVKTAFLIGYVVNVIHIWLKDTLIVDVTYVSTIDDKVLL